MSQSHDVTINGRSFRARRGELLLDAALKNGVDLPYDCRQGHCGTCCVRLLSGEVSGGQGAEPGIIHACQARVSGNAVISENEPFDIRDVDGEVVSLRTLSAEVTELGISVTEALHYHAGQYVQLRFRGFPSRPFSISHPLERTSDGRVLWFHIRRMQGGEVTPALGKRIRTGHRVTVTGPFGSAHFRPGMEGRLILVATNTGFAPIWSIAVAALHENPERLMMVIAGGRRMEALYMGTALSRLARVPNVLVVPVCSSEQSLGSQLIRQGRPTDYLPRLLPSDIVHVCGASGMVASVKAIAAHAGATCYADPFVPSTSRTTKTNDSPRVTRRLGVSSILAPSRERLRAAAPTMAHPGLRDG